MLTIKLNAGNDTNGNPRRVFVIFNREGRIVDVTDEGYGGDVKGYGGVEFATTPKEYRRLLRLGDTINRDTAKRAGRQIK